MIFSFSLSSRVFQESIPYHIASSHITRITCPTSLVFYKNVTARKVVTK